MKLRARVLGHALVGAGCGAVLPGMLTWLGVVFGGGLPGSTTQQASWYSAAVGALVGACVALFARPSKQASNRQDPPGRGRG